MSTDASWRLGPTDDHPESRVTGGLSGYRQPDEKKNNHSSSDDGRALFRILSPWVGKFTANIISTSATFSASILALSLSILVLTASLAIFVVRKIQKKNADRAEEVALDFSANVRIAFFVGEGKDRKEERMCAKAIFDTGNPINIISPSLARTLGLEIPDGEGKVKLTTLGNGEFRSIATVNGRWCFEGTKDQKKRLSGKLFFDRRFYRDDFEVAAQDDRFDLIIGSQSIVKHDLMRMTPSIGLAAFPIKDRESDKNGDKNTQAVEDENEDGSNTYVSEPVSQNERAIRHRIAKLKELGDYIGRNAGAMDIDNEVSTRCAIRVEERFASESQDDRREVESSRTSEESSASSWSHETSSGESGSTNSESQRSSQTPHSSLFRPPTMLPVPLYERVASWQKSIGRGDASEHGVLEAPQDAAGGDASKSAPNPPPRSIKKGRATNKRGRTDEKGDGDHDDNEGHRTSRRKTNASDKKQQDRMLACPFAKQNPFEHSKCLDCSFKSIHRLRQHLERSHFIPILCPRCDVKFDSDEDLNTHLRQTVACTVVEDRQVRSGIDKKTQDEIKRLRASRTKSMEENWNELFKVIFPGSRLPSHPWVEQSSLSRAWKTLGQFADQGMTRELPQEAWDRLPPGLREQREDVDAFVRMIRPMLFRDTLTEAVQNQRTIEGQVESMDSPSPSMQSVTARTIDSGFRSMANAYNSQEHEPASPTSQHMPLSSSQSSLLSAAELLRNETQELPPADSIEHTEVLAPNEHIKAEDQYYHEPGAQFTEPSHGLSWDSDFHDMFNWDDPSNFFNQARFT